MPKSKAACCGNAAQPVHTRSGSQGHVDAAVVDPHGNVIGAPDRFDFAVTGPTSHRDAQVRHVITRLIHLAAEH
jgi:hypothetical protein